MRYDVMFDATIRQYRVIVNDGDGYWYATGPWFATIEDARTFQRGKEGTS